MSIKPWNFEVSIFTYLLRLGWYYAIGNMFHLLGSSTFTRNGKIVRKCGSNWPFYALMLRTNLYWNSIFFTVHQFVNKPKSRAARTVYEPIFSPFYEINCQLFSFFLSGSKQNRMKLCYNRLHFIEETQISTA